eukprot:TRINITY_DN7_c0_g1_i1.p4 TRINITY_DN7_c0_g1~~TRINITY_DN7_c0_g1_i1.p4  ORF type:complete len:740 (-),score=132.28 TRINITY_DN7_c0_g1_i1:4303-6522(-)
MTESYEDYDANADPDFSKTVENPKTKPISVQQMLSLENYPQYEAKRLINSPRSLEACKMEGILPEELLYKYGFTITFNQQRSKRNFALPGKSPEVQQMRYERFEKKRQELLAIAKAARKKLIETIERPERNTVSRLSRFFSSTPSLEHPQTANVSICSERTKENYQEIVKRAKDRELRLMTKMLAVEENKNKKYEEHNYQKEILEEKHKEEEQKRAKIQRRKMKEKIREEMEAERKKREEEKEKRKEAERKAQEELEFEEKEKEKEKLIEKERIQFMAEKEKKRKEKAEKAEKQRQNEIFQQEIKLELLREKTMEREKLIRLQKEQQRKNALMKRQQFEQIKQKVQQNIENEEMHRLTEYLERKRKKEEQEQKVRLKQLQMAEKLKVKSDRRDLKIKDTIEESNKLIEERRRSILLKQRMAEERLQEQKRRQLVAEALKKEEVEIKNEIKRMNSERKKRKDMYKIEQVKEKQAFDEARKSAFIKANDDFKLMRLRNQTEAALQRERIRTALHNMAVWNIWDMDLVKNIIVSPSKLKSNTIEELVRARASVAASFKKSSSLRSFYTTSQNLTRATNKNGMNKTDAKIFNQTVSAGDTKKPEFIKRTNAEYDADFEQHYYYWYLCAKVAQTNTGSALQPQLRQQLTIQIKSNMKRVMKQSIDPMLVPGSLLACAFIGACLPAGLYFYFCINYSTNMSKRFTSLITVFTSGIMFALAITEFIPEVPQYQLRRIYRPTICPGN